MADSNTAPTAPDVAPGEPTAGVADMTRSAPASPGNNLDLFMGTGGAPAGTPPQTPTQAPPVASMEDILGTQAPVADATPTSSEPWSIDTFLASKIPDAPDFLKDDAKKLEDWGNVKGLLKQALEDNRAKALELAELQSRAPAAGEPGSLPEEIASELEQLRSWKSQYEPQLAKLDLQSNEAWQEKFEAGRAALLSEAEEIAREANLNVGVEDLFRQSSSYGAAKWLEDNIKDPVAKNLLGAKANDFLKLSRERQATLAASDPVAELKKWQSESVASRGTQFATAATLKKEHLLGGLAEASKKLVEQERDPFYATIEGQAVVNEWAERLNKGATDFQPGELMEMALKAEAAGAYRLYAGKLLNRLREVEAQAKGIAQTRLPVQSMAPVAPAAQSQAGSLAGVLPAATTRHAFEIK